MKSERTTGLLLLFLLTACGGGGSGGGSAATPQPPPPPVGYTYRLPADTSDGWTVADASSEGLSVSLLETMMDDIAAGMFPNVDSVAIARNGRLVFDETLRAATDSEDARVGNTDPAIHAQFSVTKSITSLVVGIAIDEGHIASVETPYLELFPYSSYDNWDERKNDITLHHVLLMQSGFEWDEWDPPYDSPDNQLIRLYEETTDYSKAVLDLPLAADPGTVFAYNTAATVSLGQAVENSAPVMLVDFAALVLLQPLGITDVEFITTPTGLPNGGGGGYFRTRDTAKFGQLLLNDGSWNGEQVVSSDWIQASLTSRTSMGWDNPSEWDWQLDGYGYQWWLGHYEVSGSSYDSFVAWGFGGQWVVAIPALGLVVAVNSHGYEETDATQNEAHALIRNYVIAAVTG